MRRLAALLVCGCVFFPPAIEASPKLISDASLKIKLQETADFEKREKLLEAQKAYEKILKENALTASQLKLVRGKLEALNIRMFFSKAETPGSFIYTVKEGDRLFDLSKKFKTTMELIRETNQIKSDELLAGSRIKIIRGKFLIRVDKSENTLDLFFEKKKVKRYSVTTGAKNKTPVGAYRIINKVENPVWYYEKKVIPPDSKHNLLGTRWMGFDKPSYGIHGTVEPEDIGKQASLGCVRMLNRDVEELYTLVPLGTQVIIQD